MLERKDYVKVVACYQDKLNQKLCPKCGQGKLTIALDFDEQSLKIDCNNCSAGKWSSWDSFMKDHNSLEKYKAFDKTMHNLNKKAFKNTLNKRVLHIITKGENVITKQEYQDAILNNPISIADLYNNIDRLKSSLKLCSKAELIVLRTIINMGNEKSELIYVQIKGLNNTYNLKLNRITRTIPITYEIKVKSELINTHGILRNIINKGLISVNEVENYIDIHSLLLKEITYIAELLIHNYILSEEETYKVFSSNNFRCSNCGESGIPLRVAFLSKCKNISTAVPICSVCYDSITDNGIIIDGSIILFDSMYKIKSWTFVKKFVPNFSEKYFKEFYLLTLKYGENNMIKAVAQGLFQMETGKVFSKLIYFYKYILKILENAVSKGEDVHISELVMERYDVEEWCKLI